MIPMKQGHTKVAQEEKIDLNDNLEESELIMEPLLNGSNNEEEDELA